MTDPDYPQDSDYDQFPQWSDEPAPPPPGYEQPPGYGQVPDHERVPDYGQIPDHAHAPGYGQTPNATDAPRPRKRRALPFLIGGLALLIIASLGGGFAGGWFVKDSMQAATLSPTQEVIVVETSGPQSGDDLELAPDLRGMSLMVAKQVLADIGFPVFSLEVTSTPWAGQEGLVVGQDPVGGEVLGSSMTLLVSEGAKTPDVVGETRAVAVTAVQEFGAEAVITEIYQFDVPTGTVLSQSPEPGEALPEQVNLTVAQAGSSVFLYKLPTADSSGYCYTRDVSLNGSLYSDALECRASSDEGSTVAWVLGRHASYFTATVGVSDAGKADSSATVTVLADGVAVQTVSASYGQTTSLGVDVEGVLRLEIRFVSDQRTDVYLADALIKGTDDQMDLLVEDS